MIWFYSIKGATSEAVDQSIIEKMIFQGQLSGLDYVWREGWQEWRALQDADEFSHALAQKRVPCPPPLPNNIGSKQASSNGQRAGEEKEWEIAPNVKMTFCWCPAGNFTMGSPKTEKERNNNNEDQVHVTLTKGFWMAKTQVTQKQWATIMGKNPSHFRGAKLPVENVSWYDAQDFLEELNTKIGNTDGGKMMLPTEAQWEYACRAGETGPYSGGTIDQVAWYRDNSGRNTHAVGMKKSNAWGLYDMHGNVWEWCADWWCGNLPGGIDPSGPSSGSLRVLRGGSWLDGAIGCRAASRSYYNPAHQDSSIYGFRVARSSVH